MPSAVGFHVLYVVVGHFSYCMTINHSRWNDKRQREVDLMPMPCASIVIQPSIDSKLRSQLRNVRRCSFPRSTALRHNTIGRVAPFYWHVAQVLYEFLAILSCACAWKPNKSTKNPMAHVVCVYICMHVTYVTVIHTRNICFCLLNRHRRRRCRHIIVSFGIVPRDAARGVDCCAVHEPWIHINRRCQMTKRKKEKNIQFFTCHCHANATRSRFHTSDGPSDKQNNGKAYNICIQTSHHCGVLQVFASLDNTLFGCMHNAHKELSVNPTIHIQHIRKKIYIQKTHIVAPLRSQFD